MKKARTATGSRRPLPDYIQRALRTGEKTWDSNGYSRNHLVFSIGLSMFQNGWSMEDFIDEILSPNNLAGEKFQDMYEPKARRQLESDWNRIADFVSDNPPEKGTDIVRKRLGRTYEQVLAMKWSGRTGNTDRLVLITIIELSMERGTYTPAFSTRTLAMATNKRQETIIKSLARLRQAGHINLVTPSTYTKSARYEITVKEEDINGSLNTNTSRQSIKRPVIVPIHDLMSHDIFSPGALGATAGRLWLELDPGREYSTKEMAEVIGVSQRTVRRAVSGLVGVGLMSSTEGGRPRYTVEAPYGHDLAYLDQIMSVEADMCEDESPDLTDSVGKGDRRSDRYKAQQAARKIDFAHFDKVTECFVDPVTGELIELPQVLLDGSQNASESLPDFLPAWDATDPFRRPEAA